MNFKRSIVLNIILFILLCFITSCSFSESKENTSDEIVNASITNEDSSTDTTKEELIRLFDTY